MSRLPILCYHNVGPGPSAGRFALLHVAEAKLELAEAIAEVAGNVLAGPSMRPGDVRRLVRKTQEDDEV